MPERVLVLNTPQIRRATMLGRQHNLNMTLDDGTLARLRPKIHIVGSFRMPHYHAGGKIATLPHYRCQVVLAVDAEGSVSKFLDVPTSLLDEALMIEVEANPANEREPIVRWVEGVRLQAPWDPADAGKRAIEFADHDREGDKVTLDEDGIVSGLIGVDGDEVTLDDVTLHSPSATAALAKVSPEERPAFLQRVLEEGARMMQESGMDDEKPAHWPGDPPSVRLQGAASSIDRSSGSVILYREEEEAEVKRLEAELAELQARARDTNEKNEAMEIHIGHLQAELRDKIREHMDRA